jgi:hypothetical protein
MILIPGVIDVTTNYLEHPEVVADRIELFVDVMGGDRSRVIAGADCGFSTVAGYMMVAEDVVWAKLRALADGASIASRRLRRSLGRSPVKRRSAPKKVRVATHTARKLPAKSRRVRLRRDARQSGKIKFEISGHARNVVEHR